MVDIDRNASIKESARPMKALFPLVALLALGTLPGCALRPPVDEMEPMHAATEVLIDPALSSGVDQPPPEAAPSADTDIWTRVRAGFALDLEQDNARIRAQRDWYARNQAYLDRVMTRAARYLHYIVEEAERREVPLEMVLLPVVESAFDPFAYSHGRASGPWQFIQSTGRMFGMQQDFWHDGRRDIIASTEGALSYLQRLADRFDGDWHKALASYNAGAGNVSRAERRNLQAGRATDYWSLYLPRETMAYVPKLIALAQIVQDPEAYGVTLKPIADEPYFEVVETGGQIDMTRAAELADTSVEELYMLNPHINQWATPPTGPHRLLVPLDKADGFRERLAALPAEERVAWQEYQIRPGDNLGSIARRFNTTASLLRSVNRLHGNTIIAGRTLLIPGPRENADSYSLSADARLEARQNRALPGRRKVVHRVRPGDSFWELARTWQVGTRELASWNNMAPGDTLRVGQELVIWTTSSAAPAIASVEGQPNMIRRVNYAVRRGDSLYRIANRFNLSVNEIQRWNSINPNRYLQPGQRLTLYVDIRDAN